MQLVGIVEEDFVNYKKPSLTLMFPKCSFKCDKENKANLCQNSELAKAPLLEVEIPALVERYLANPITSAIVCSGLEPFDSKEDLFNLIQVFRAATQDDIVIYTGYYPEEKRLPIRLLKQFSNIIIKFGRFIPDDKPHFDSVLGVNLISTNQFAFKIS